MKDRQLSPKECQRIEEKANEKLAQINKQNDILGEQIFDILKRHCRVLFYPLKDDDVWGFYEKIKGNSFICINSSIDLDKQVFVAAHELYHLWFNHAEELILASELEERDTDIPLEELKANRFAAEFLVPEMLLRQEIRASKINDEKIDTAGIVTLARAFMVPYRTMVKRLHEINMITPARCSAFLEVSEEEVSRWRKRLGIELLERTNNISLDNLVDKALSAFEQQQINRTRLEYLLSLAHTSPAELGIPDEEKETKPSDDELDALMED
ncbi:MAG: ImmA/IrrE family metallo-endopeptidase [Deltaproteobacteria bacterium]|nr:ImmA/IrrE family metallo-endopeptidase [Deltaproteobacteria bacterium]